MPHRIHIFGASGSGTTTLGKALAGRLRAKFLDTDSYYWLPTDPPFTGKRDPVDRIAMIERDVRDTDDWVLSGSICSWGDPLLHHFTFAVFLYLQPALRMDRLARRERARYGDRIAPDGDMHATHIAFMDWARSYDTATAPVRSLDLHETWMRALACPAMRLDSSRPVAALCDEILARTLG